MDINPIQERTSSINKIIKWFKSLFKKKKKPDYEKILAEVQINAKNNYEAYSKFGMSCESAAYSMKQMGMAFAKFDEILPKNEIRKRMDMDECTLYADNKPYCIIRKGEPIWLEKNK